MSDWLSERALTYRFYSVTSTLLISAPIARSLLFSTIDSVWLSVCLSVRLSRPFKLLIFFCFSTESSHFWPSFLHVVLYKTLFLDFKFRPPNSQNLLPKICTKSPISRPVWQIDRRCLGLPGGFRDGRFNGTVQNVVGPIPVAMATKFGLGAEIQSPTGLSSVAGSCWMCWSDSSSKAKLDRGDCGTQRRRWNRQSRYRTVTATGISVSVFSFVSK